MNTAIMTRTDCLREYGSDHLIRRKLAAGELYRLGRNIYTENGYVPELALLAFRYPDAVITMYTAFYLYGMTDVIPDYYDLATDRDAPKIADKRVHQYFQPHGFFRTGVTQLDYKGFPVAIYDQERMLIEIVRYKTKVPFDFYKEIIQYYRKELPKMNIQKIQDYAYESPKSNKIFEILQTEVL